MNKNNTIRGFTLPEILVSTAIGAIILAALFVSFIMFQRSYELQREMTRNQESGRMTLDFMVEEIRNAGYKDFNKGSPVPINQAVILESPTTNLNPSGTLPADCGENISVMYDIVPSQNDMTNYNFVRRIVKYYGEKYAPGGVTALSRCRLKRHQCHYAYVASTAKFNKINNNSKYPCEEETVLDYLYDLSFSFSDYKYDHFAGRLHPLTRAAKSSHNYATSGCINDFKKNVACGQYPNRARTVDMNLSIVSGNEVSSVPDDPSDNPDKGRRFLTFYNATMVLRNL
tara:strand:+ start:1553 stop:2410 length:858 start_codon:yes stop_codon:yes gene_type:complete